VPDHIVDANKMVELSRALTRAGVDTPVFRAIDGYWYDDDEGRNEVTIERVERELCYAAILWLMGRGWQMFFYEGRYHLIKMDGPGDRGNHLIDALLDAVKREASNG